MADALRITGENTARLVGGTYLKARWFDILHPKPEETRTAEEIIEHMSRVLSGEKE